MDALLEPPHLVALLWLVAGLVLSAIETLAPGAFFIWFGAAAAIVGAVAYFLPMGFVAQLILFAVLVAALVLVGRRVYGSLDRGPGRCRKAAPTPWSGPTSSSMKRSRAAMGASASATVRGASPDPTARRAPG